MKQCAQIYVDFLNSKNFNFKTAESKSGDSIVDFPYNGRNVRAVFSGDIGEYLSLYLQFESVPDAKFAEMVLLCNQLNAKYKWVKFYVDSENDLMLDDNAILSPGTAADEAFELVVRMHKIAEEVKPEIMRALYV